MQFLSVASLMAVASAQAPFPIMTDNAPSSVISKVSSELNAYFISLYVQPAWSSASRALQTEVPEFATNGNVNGDPVSLAEIFLLATATPTWYTQLPNDIQRFVSSVANAEASIVSNNVDGPTSALASPTFITSKTATSEGGTSTGTGSSGTDSSGTSNSGSNIGNSQSSSGWDQLSIGAKVGIIVGAIAGVAFIALIGWYIWFRERRYRFDRTVASDYHNVPGYSADQSPGYPVYQPSSMQPLNSASHMQQSGYAPSRYPVTEVDWNHENKQPRYTGSEIGASDIASWRDGTNTIIAPTQH